MKVNAIYEINDRYVVGDDRCIYKLPTTIGKKSYKLKKLSKHRGGYFIDSEFIMCEKIQYKAISPYILIDTEKLPF